MDARDLLIDGIGRSREVCHLVLNGLDADAANQRPGGDHNSIGWLVWHLARQQDAQIARLAGGDQVWVRDGFVDRFALDVPPQSIGFGQTAEQAGKVVIRDLALLADYVDAATDATIAYVRGLDPASLDEVIDRSYTPPVTRGVRLVSIVDDASQHAGQAAYVRGLVAGWRAPY